MKYLIMEDFSGQPVPFLFPRRVNHLDMREQLPYSKVISAGFLEFEQEGSQKLICHGGNSELNLQARPEDVKIILEAVRVR